MRIIGGRFRSRVLRAPRGANTRPTTDRVKEALFSALTSRLELTDLRVLDLYAGTGALGLEALSRGAGSVTFVEHDREALRALEHNIESLGVRAHTRVLAQPVERARLTGPFDLIFADPPYELVARGAFAAVWAEVASACAAGSTLVLEHGTRDAAPELAYRTIATHRAYGDTAITIYEPTLGILAAPSL